MRVRVIKKSGLFWKPNAPFGAIIEVDDVEGGSLCARGCAEPVDVPSPAPAPPADVDAPVVAAARNAAAKGWKKK